MSLIVQKYGGTSVGSTDRIRRVANRLLETQRDGHRVVGVVSAMAGVTNRLHQLAAEVSRPDPQPTEREMDVLLATGEQQSIALTAMAINSMGGMAVSLTGAQAGIETDGVHTRARIDDISPDEIKKFLNRGHIVIVAGFQGTTREGRITTLGRGGSDLSAIAIAAAIKADHCQILTDVDGVYTCDPRVVPQARRIESLSYEEMLELASSGTKVMQNRAVEFANKFGIRFEVRSSLNHNPGTIVTEENKSMESVVVRGVSLEREQAEVTIENVPDRPGVASRIFRTIADQNLNIDMIVQNVSKTGVARISFTLHRGDLTRARSAIQPILDELAAEARLLDEDGIAKLSAVGIGMRSHSGVASQMFSALADAGINIRMISTSEIKISVTIDENDAERAANVVHDTFKLHMI